MFQELYVGFFNTLLGHPAVDVEGRVSVVERGRHHSQVYTKG